MYNLVYFVTDIYENVRLGNDHCYAGPLAGQLFICCKVNFVAIFKSQTVHASSTYWALQVHNTFSDLDCISRSQQCQTVLTENFMFLTD